MRIQDLIARKKQEINTLTQLANDLAEELHALRESPTVTPAQVAPTRQERAETVAKIARLQTELAELEREQAADNEIERKQREVHPTDARANSDERIVRGGDDTISRSEAPGGWINRDNGEPAAVRRNQSVRSHPVFARSQRVGDDHARAQYGDLGMMVRAMSTSGGSAIVPVDWAAGVIDKAREQSAVFRAGATLIPMDAGTLKLGRLTGDPSAAFRTENSEISPSDLTLDNVTLTSRTMSTLVVGSLEWFQDAENAEGVVEDAIAKAMAEHLDLVALYGGIESGAGSIDLDTDDGYPTGLLAELLAVSSAPNVLGASAGVTATNGTSITAATPWNEVLDTIYKVKIGNEEPNAIVWSPRMAQKLAKTYDSTYQPLRQPEDVAALTKITTSKIPTYTQGSNTTATDVFVGDWSKLLIGERLDLTLQVLTERYAEKGQIGIVAHWRGDIALARPSAFAVYKALQGA